MSEPLKPGERWWDRPECMRGHVARGFDFHATGKTPRGQHVLDKLKRAKSDARAAEEAQPEGDALPFGDD